MFKPIRWIILMLVAFVAGVLFERHNAAEACDSAGGIMTAGICRGAS